MNFQAQHSDMLSIPQSKHVREKFINNDSDYNSAKGGWSYSNKKPEELTSKHPKSYFDSVRTTSDIGIKKALANRDRSRSR